MGIAGLLPLLKDITIDVNIRKYACCTVAVDTSCLIYKASASCARDLALGIPTDK